MARLRAAGGCQDDDDAVARRQRFEETHPDVTISPPETHASLWTARRDGKILATGYHLCDLSLIVRQGHIHRDLSEQAADLAAPVIENVQGVVPDHRHAQHAHGQQVLGRDLIRHFGPVTAPAKALKVRA